MATPYDKRFGFLVSDIGRLMSTEFDRRARGRLELSRAQCRMALYLSFFGQMTQAQLAETLDVTPMTVARMLDRMQQGGWIVRTPVPNDRRAFHVRATPKAEEMLAEALQVGDELNDFALRGLSREEKDVLIGLLQKVRSNLAPPDR
ncbi:MarR family transcriptional regulator [Pigmentiphaga sp. NML080357]|uniref:MarR family winged helix-turn-helix transcriptional regulator n=1 Tax=Pigmentiphaga sp. NML080357 TaxID=2008675 RepID=UPI000B40D097|nr:MarR family transcriptional regulator [Pigmentiphaga sp. NML080357]OVZ61411.1 MarR family transcriptional regulator [Pigmentiphaga sp. NML080357]